MKNQMSLLDFPEVQFEKCEVKMEKSKAIRLLPLDEYDKVIISESGGKDSMACLFHLLNLGVPPGKIELWHQSVNGREDRSVELFDWPCMEDYIQAVGDHFGIKVCFQWREYGLYGELMRKDSLTGDVYYCDDNGEVHHLPTKNGKKSTRLRWPALSADLRVRYCSPYVKIDVFRRVLNNHPDFKGTKDNPTKTLVITGERRLESINRSKYLEAELHPCNSQSRLVHAWRPVIDWNETQIWDEYEKRKFLPAPPYLLGWNRTSCFGCIFSTSDYWAMMREIAPERFRLFAEIEKEINHTIDPTKITLEEKANLGSLKRLPNDKRLSQWVNMALTRGFNKENLIMDKWELPAGALYEGPSGGPI